MKKNTGRASVRELKAAALDTLVKSELAKTQAAQAKKISRLRELRLARDAEQQTSGDPIEKSTLSKRKPMALRSRPKRISVPAFAPPAVKSSSDGL